MYSTDELPIISLFTGAGGLDLGLEEAGFTTRVAVEKDKWARQTLHGNRGHFRKEDFPILEDVTKHSADEIVDAAGLTTGEAFLVAGGPPCQSFSTAGRRASLGDPRGSLFRNFAAVVDAARPRFFVMENVRGLRSAAISHRPLLERGPDAPPLQPDEEQGSAFRVICNVLEEELGYQLTYGLLYAADFGAPQNRLRLIVLGSRDAEFLTRDLAHIVVPTHRGRWVTLRQALLSLNGGPPEYLRYTPEREAILRQVPEGMNWRYFRDHPDHGPERAAELMGGAWEADGGRVGFFRRLRWDRPSPTLPTSPIQKSTSLCHPSETRPLSVQEYAAIQQFPPDYRFAGGTAQKYKQIGNAVPVGLGRAIGLGLSAAAGRQDPEAGQRRLFEATPVYAVASPDGS
ncbi:MAG: DNA cytosine methyltransferase [Tepidiformaceae bacterium]